MTRDLAHIGSSDAEPTEPLNGTEEWLGKPGGVEEDGSLRVMGDEPVGQDHSALPKVSRRRQTLRSRFGEVSENFWSGRYHGDVFASYPSASSA